MSSSEQATAAQNPAKCTICFSRTRKSFYFVQNRIEFRGSLPVEVIPNHFFQRGDSGHVHEIKRQLRLFQGVDEYWDVAGMMYEKPIATIPSQEGVDEAHRYWVISFPGGNHEEMELSIAASLLRNDLQFGLTFIAHSCEENDSEFYAYIRHPDFLFNFYQSERWCDKPVSTIEESDLKQIGQNYSLLKRSLGEFPNFHKAGFRLLYLNGLPQSSEFLILGLFSIIESVITHKPKNTDPTDALTRQITSKMELLKARFQRPLDDSAYFHSANHKTIWDKLYEYRSDIAHGTAPDFENSLKILRGPENVKMFLREATKLVVLQALMEPELISNLKNC